MSSNDCTPDNILKNPLLESLCACKKASDDLSSALTTYNKQVEDYNLGLERHKELKIKYNNDVSVWETNKQNTINSLKAERKYTNCELIPKACHLAFGSGWTFDNSQGGCGTWAGTQNNCKRTSTQITTDLGPWLSSNPSPKDPGEYQGKPPNNAPSGININCCSQLFNDIDATNVNFSNITQNCSQIIQTKIEEAKSSDSSINDVVPINAPIPVKEEQVVAEKKENLIDNNIIIIIGISFLILFLILILIM